MKKYLLSIFIVIKSFAISSAQTYIPFPTDSVQWSIRQTMNSPFSQNSWQYKMKGDTVLNGITYHKIYYSLDLLYSSTNQTLDCFVREDTTKKVFVKYPYGIGTDTSEFLLYDFNLSIGDTVTVKLIHYTTDSIFKLYVTNISTIMGETYLQPINTTLWGGCDPYIVWVQGRGCNFSPFYSEIPEGYCDNGASEGVVCFWQNGSWIGAASQCDISTNLNSNKEIGNIQLLPNPVTDISEMNLNGEFVLLEIYNLLGEKIKSENIKGKSKVLISRKDFNEGTFIYKIITCNKLYQTGKFIIN